MKKFSQYAVKEEIKLFKNPQTSTTLCIVKKKIKYSIAPSFDNIQFMPLTDILEHASTNSWLPFISPQTHAYICKNHTNTHSYTNIQACSSVDC